MAHPNNPNTRQFIEFIFCHGGLWSKKIQDKIAKYDGLIIWLKNKDGMLHYY